MPGVHVYVKVNTAIMHRRSHGCSVCIQDFNNIMNARVELPPYMMSYMYPMAAVDGAWTHEGAEAAADRPGRLDLHQGCQVSLRQ
jgi:hypothetical protein